MPERDHKPTLANLPSARVLVVGDKIDDIWIYGRVERISPEAPVPVFVQERTVEQRGGAGNVMANIAALGADGMLVADRTTMETPKKMRYVAGGQQIFRVDIEQFSPTNHGEEDDAFYAATRYDRIGCIVLSDYGKGMLTRTLCQKLIDWAIHFGIPVVVDPKGDDWSKYEGATVITPNEKEWEAVAEKEWGDPAFVLITKGANGMRLADLSGPAYDIPAQAKEVFDVTGAGDTVVAVLACCLAVGFDMEAGARIANAAAGVVVGKRGTATCSLDELKDAWECSSVAERRSPKPQTEVRSLALPPYTGPLAFHRGIYDPPIGLRETSQEYWIDMARAKLATKRKTRDIAHWERGWVENLEEYRRTGDIAALRPKYIRGGPVRWKGRFWLPEDEDYEWKWYQRFFGEIADRWLADSHTIREFGCGSGHNIAALARRFPTKNIIGYDWSQASVDICRELEDTQFPNRIGGYRFDFFAPTEHPPGSLEHSTVLTVGAMEQTGRLWRPFLNWLLAMKPMRVVHIEPILDWYDLDNPVDLTAIEAHRERGFWAGYLDTLRGLEQEGRVKIEHAERTGFGSLLIEGYSQLIWRPL